MYLPKTCNYDPKPKYLRVEYNNDPQSTNDIPQILCNRLICGFLRLGTRTGGIEEINDILRGSHSGIMPGLSDRPTLNSNRMNPAPPSPPNKNKSPLMVYTPTIGFKVFGCSSLCWV